MFVDLQNAIVPVLIPQTATPAVTGWNSNWVIGGLIGAGLLIGWLASGYGKPKPKKRGVPIGYPVRKSAPKKKKK